MNYALEMRHPPRHSPEWYVAGLHDPGFPGINALTPRPDTRLCVGLRHSCDTVDSVIDSIHSELYDLYQVCDALKKGDTFTSKPCRYPKLGAFDARWGYLDIPALRFRCEGVHVLRDDAYNHSRQLAATYDIGGEG